MKRRRLYGYQHSRRRRTTYNAEAHITAGRLHKINLQFTESQLGQIRPSEHQLLQKSRMEGGPRRNIGNSWVWGRRKRCREKRTAVGTVSLKETSQDRESRTERRQTRHSVETKGPLIIKGAKDTENVYTPASLTGRKKRVDNNLMLK